ncbi:hypothetical protein CMK13_00750 [Candidatus Poribacteria bacterium]|nr:hypothetical protein [Candidatus Poribacteria bacterium]OUT68037.1 MAG: hypothetical protein CBB75_00540 [bacterium TMED15]
MIYYRIRQNKGLEQLVKKRNDEQRLLTILESVFFFSLAIGITQNQGKEWKAILQFELSFVKIRKSIK